MSWMASRGIVVAPVTIDNNDYLSNPAARRREGSGTHD